MEKFGIDGKIDVIMGVLARAGCALYTGDFQRGGLLRANGHVNYLLHKRIKAARSSPLRLLCGMTTQIYLFARRRRYPQNLSFPICIQLRFIR